MFAVTVRLVSKFHQDPIISKAIELIEFSTGVQFTKSQRDRVLGRWINRKELAIICVNKNERDYVLSSLKDTTGSRSYIFYTVDITDPSDF